MQSRPILTGADAKKTFEVIPQIDVSNIFSPDLAVRKKLAMEIGQAVKQVGFFYAVKPPVSTKLMGMLRCLLFPNPTKPNTFDQMSRSLSSRSSSICHSMPRWEPLSLS